MNGHGRFLFKKLLIKKFLFEGFLPKSQQITQELAQAIVNYDRDEISRVIESPHPGYFNVHYRDAYGNTLMYMAAKQAQNRWSSRDYFEKIIKALNSIGIRTDIPDRENKLPMDYLEHDWLQKALDRLDDDKCLNNRISKIEKEYLYSDRTRVYPGIRLTPNLGLYFGSKNPLKRCEIPNRFPSLDSQDNAALFLHERLAMAAVYQKRGDFSDANNYVTINIGFVVSAQPYASTRQEERRRRFVTVPIRDLRFAVVYREGEGERVHAEIVLYQYLSDPKNLEELIDGLRENYGIHPGFKIYAVILDIHTQRNMCSVDGCTRVTYENQLGDSFIQILENILDRYQYKLPKVKTPCPDLLTSKTRRLHVVTRISHGKSFDSDDMESFSSKYAASIPVFREELPDRDVKKFGNAVVLNVC